MMQKEDQDAYLAGLVSKLGGFGVREIAAMVEDKNFQCQRSLEGGEYSITEKSQAVPLLPSRQPGRDIQPLVQQRKLLQDKLRLIDKSAVKETRVSLVVSDEVRLEFLKRMRQQQGEILRSRDESQRAKDSKARQQQEEERELKEAQLKERQGLRRQQIEKKIQEISDYKEKREGEIKERNKDYQVVAHAQTLEHRIQQNYDQIKNHSLEEKKRKLAQIREIHKPMSSDEFQQHLSRIQQYRSIQTSQKQSIRNSSKSLSPAAQIFYQSHWYKAVINEEKSSGEEHKEEQKETLRGLKDRQKQYSEYIKHNFVPEADEELVEQLQSRKPVPIKRKKAKEIRQLGLLNLQAAKERILTKEEVQARRRQSETELQGSTGKPNNYLQQLKKNRKGVSLSERFLKQFNKKDTSERSKLETIKSYAQKLEQKAQQRQKLQRVRNKLVDPELDEMYMGALNAKLQLLAQK